jgi:hypothetical protein
VTVKNCQHCERVRWLPIETAPHETRVLLGWWYDGVWISEVGEASHGWTRNGISNMSRHGQAVYWRPLPTGPEPAVEPDHGEDTLGERSPQVSAEEKS